jgi:hypothetical protein
MKEHAADNTTMPANNIIFILYLIMLIKTGNLLIFSKEEIKSPKRKWEFLNVR